MSHAGVDHVLCAGDVMANVLLGVLQGQLSITATDLKVELVASTEVARITPE